MFNSDKLDIRLAQASDVQLVQEISAEAYIPASEAVIGTVPAPAYENYSPRVSRGEVWLLHTFDATCGVVVLEKKEQHLLVYSIAVRPVYQRLGYGQLLLKFADQRAGHIGASEVRLYTNTRMQSNISLYRRCGFQEIKTRPHPSRSGEFLIDMSKFSSPTENKLR